MRVAVMQPYLFPYIGYFQLVAMVDEFVFLDDVAYINRGWINRNRILQNGSVRYFTVPLSRASQNRSIDEIATHEDGKFRDRLLRSLHHAYGRAPFFGTWMPLIESVFKSSPEPIADLARRSIEAVSSQLGLRTKFHRSSAAITERCENPTTRILELCARLGADTYVNLAGGVDLYEESDFAARNVNLEFCNPVCSAYPQAAAEFVPSLSIIDVLMNCEPGRVLTMTAQAERLSRARMRARRDPSQTPEPPS